MCISGLRISTSLSHLMESAVTSQGPSALISTVLAPSQCSFAVKPFMLRTISVTSSFTPGIVENSWRTPSILMEVTATPGSEESNTLLKLFPSVVPKPRSSGSTTNLP